MPSFGGRSAARARARFPNFRIWVKSSSYRHDSVDGIGMPFSVASSRLRPENASGKLGNFDSEHAMAFRIKVNPVFRTKRDDFTRVEKTTT
jgi:hypothetical protein